jgi:hypothetical protein
VFQCRYDILDVKNLYDILVWAYMISVLLSRHVIRNPFKYYFVQTRTERFSHNELLSTSRLLCYNQITLMAYQVGAYKSE